MKKFLVITSIAKPNKILRQIYEQSYKNSVTMIVVGDKKSPRKFNLKRTKFLSLKNQNKLNVNYSKHCPINSYSRKNVGYLYALMNDADVIFETDDDNKLSKPFFKLKPKFGKFYSIKNNGWTNIYNFFTKKLIWPRGFPLDEINNKNKIRPNRKTVKCPINQRLANGNPDVDAIYRLTQKLPINFNKNKDIALGKNSWCPFNSQNTVWHKEVFPLLYLPSYSTFRMSDIWRSFIAQRICWENNWYILHSNATVKHDRNNHNLINDFEDEIPGYLNNSNIAKKLNSLNLKSGIKNLSHNLRQCYKLLCNEKLIDKKELKLLDIWLNDVKFILNNDQ